MFFMEKANTCEVEVDGKRLLVYVGDKDGRKAVEGIWIKGGRDPHQLFNGLCDDHPWCYDGINGLPDDDDEKNRTKLRDEVVRKVRDILGEDVIFPIKTTAREW